MNKKEIDKLIPIAYESLKAVGIAKCLNDGEYSISKTFRGYISSFGAAITMGSFKAAVVYFSKDTTGKTNDDRFLLVDSIYYVLKNKKPDKDNLITLACGCDTVESENKLKEEVINAAIAIKLAMNMYKLS